MSLNKLTTTVQKEWMNIGCDQIVCNELTVNGQAIISNPLVFSSTTGGFSSSISTPQTILSTLSAGIGSLTSSGYKAGDQLKFSTRFIINSPTAVNNVQISILPMSGTVIQIPYNSYTTNTNIVLESIFTFVTDLQAYLVTTAYLPLDVQNISYGPAINFPSNTYNLSLSAFSTAPSTLTMVQTTVTLL